MSYLCILLPNILPTSEESSFAGCLGECANNLPSKDSAFGTSLCFGKRVEFHDEYYLFVSALEFDVLCDDTMTHNHADGTDSINNAMYSD